MNLIECFAVQLTIVTTKDIVLSSRYISNPCEADCHLNVHTFSGELFPLLKLMILTQHIRNCFLEY